MAAGPLDIATPDGSGQVVHPDVLDTEGFAGHRFWMVCTPYPFSDDRLENPLLRVSPDGLHWRALPGAPDPLVPAPEDDREHWSDVDLVLVDGALQLVFRRCVRGRPEAELFTMSSVDGTTWTEPRKFWHGHRAVSPAVVVDAEGVTMWHIEADSVPSGEPGTLVRQRGPSLTALGDRQVCRLDLPGFVLWHLDVVATDDGYEALVAAYPQRANASRCRLFHAVSEDGLTFRPTERPVLEPRTLWWASRVIYRSTFVKHSDGTYTVWFTGGSWGKRWGIGCARGPMDRLVPVAGGPSAVWPRGWRRVREDAAGFVSYVVQYRLPDPLRRALSRCRAALSARLPAR